jgi:hypothetical protein
VSLTALAIVLTAVGGACELAGLWIVVRGILQDRQRAARLLVRRERKPGPKRSYPAEVFSSGLTPPWASSMYGDRMQMRGVIEHVQRLEASVANILIRIRKAVDTELDNSVANLREEMAQHDDALRDILTDLLAGSIRDRWTGVVLLGLGIALAVAGSIVGNVA